MGIVKNNYLPSIVKNIPVHCVSDERGLLCFTDNTELPFPVERVFWISEVPENCYRGGHAHKVCAEILFPLSGEFDVYVDDGKSSVCCHLDKSSDGLYIGPNVWCRVDNFSSDAVCMVLASHQYLKDGYINDYEEFRRYIEEWFVND
ncbi:MAG: FdtA/QdtA family cupin domain-containing protein [Bacteroidaceae bacterium]|nr:FdtA/QdtA family cupin domain-containing protein [Bacteroidaceae bacterium]